METQQRLWSSGIIKNKREPGQAPDLKCPTQQQTLEWAQLKLALARQEPIPPLPAWALLVQVALVVEHPAGLERWLALLAAERVCVPSAPLAAGAAAQRALEEVAPAEAAGVALAGALAASPREAARGAAGPAPAAPWLAS